MITNIFMVAGISIIIGGIYAMLSFFREENKGGSGDLFWGFGYFFGCLAGAFVGMIGIILILIGQLLKR